MIPDATVTINGTVYGLDCDIDGYAWAGDVPVCPACDDDMREQGTHKGISVDYAGRGAYQPLVVCPTCDEKYPLIERVW